MASGAEEATEEMEVSRQPSPSSPVAEPSTLPPPLMPDEPTSPVDPALGLDCAASDASSPSSGSSSSSFIPFSSLLITCPIVGRQHYSAASSSSSSSSPAPSLLLIREPHNPRDPNAIKAFLAQLPTPAIAAIGHVPARLAAILSPLLDLHCLVIASTAIISQQKKEEGGGDAEEAEDANVTAQLSLSPHPAFDLRSQPHLRDRLHRHLCDLQSYAALTASDHTHRFIRNFQLVSTSCLARFPHLFTDDDRRLLSAFLALSLPSQHLYCRLMLRKQVPSPLMAQVVAALAPSASSLSASSSSSSSTPPPLLRTPSVSPVARWFQLRSLRYKQVVDVEAAVAELVRPPQPPTSPAPAASAPCNDLPPLLSSPCKQEVQRAEAGSAAVTFANAASSSPYSSSQYTLVDEQPDQDEDDDCIILESAPAAGRPVPASRSLWPQPGTKLVSDKESKEGELSQPAAEAGVGFMESSLCSSLPAAALWSSLLDSLTVAMVRELCSRLDIRAPSGGAAAMKASLLQLMTRQRTLSGRCMLDDPRVLRALHLMTGGWLRLTPRFLLLCQQLYRLFFLSEDVSHSSIASAASPMILEDLGLAKWAQPNPPAGSSSSSSRSASPAPSQASSATLLFPTRACFLSWDASLQLTDVMSYAVDDFEAEMRCGFLHVPLALACLDEAWTQLQQEAEHAHRGQALPFTLIERLHRHSADQSAAAFPCDFQALLSSFSPAAASSSSFILRYRAASHYTAVVHVGIAVLERLHRYAEATSLLLRLLSLPYCPQRRGAWWNRLSLNLATHLGCKRAAMLICQQGQSDASVRTGDRVELSRRWRRLWRHREGGNGLGIAPAVDGYDVPLPSTAKKGSGQRRRGSSDRKAAGKKRRNSSPALRRQRTTGEPEAEETEDEDADCLIVSSLPRSVSSPGPSLSSFAAPVPASSCISQQTIQGRPLNREVGSKSRFVSMQDSTLCTVEELALQHYAQEEEGGWRGWHCENSLFLTLFGLLMWEAVWQGGEELQAVWLSPYQSAPLDLQDGEAFYLRRREKVEAVLQELREAPDVGALLSRQWWRHLGERCRGVQWRRWTIEELQQVVRCMGSEAVAGVMRVLVMDYAHWGGGLPDLFLFRTHTQPQQLTSTRDADAVIVISSDDEQQTAAVPRRPARVKEERKRSTKATGRKGSRETVRSAKAEAVAAASPRLCSDLVKLVEVKGPRDRLSAQQLAWLHVLAPVVPVEVCYVREDCDHIMHAS